jgi:hypothetical protein
VEILYVKIVQLNVRNVKQKYVMTAMVVVAKITGVTVAIAASAPTVRMNNG